MNKWILALIGLAVAGLVAGVIAFSGTEPEATPANDSQNNQAAEVADTESMPGAVGELTAYSPEKLAESEAEANILFFHASWCTVCNSVERAIMAGTIPEGMVIFKLDYESDEGQQLAEKYNIPIQYTMVQVDNAGNEITQWVNNYNDGPDEFKQRIEQT